MNIRALVLENRYIFHGTFCSLIFGDYQIFGSFYIPPYLLISCAYERISRDVDAFKSFFGKNWCDETCRPDDNNARVIANLIIVISDNVFHGHINYTASTEWPLSLSFLIRVIKLLLWENFALLLAGLHRVLFFRRLHLNFPSSLWTPRCTWREVSTYL